MDFIARVGQTIERHGMLRGARKLLVACSGGPDSVALLIVLDELRPVFGYRLACFHLNHRLRGRAADADERFVGRLCRRRAIPCLNRRCDIRVYARRHRQSVEEAGRHVRYRRLTACAQRVGADRVALGHHADDNAETMLLNLVRGTGPAGLAGIPPQRDLVRPVGRRARLRVVRPLIEVSRAEIIRFLRARRQPFRVDRTNTDINRARNFVRARVMPGLRALNPGILDAFARLGAVLRDEGALLDGLARKAVPRLARRDRSGAWVLDIRKLRVYNNTLTGRILRQLVPSLDSGGVERARDIVVGATGRRVQVAPAVWAWREYDHLWLGPKPRAPRRRSWSLKLGRRTRLAGLDRTIEARIVRHFDLTHKPVDCEVFDLDQLAFPLAVRLRQPGDRFVPFGKEGEKRLKKMLIDDRVPARLRQRLPVLCDRTGILWVLGGRRANRAPITARTRRVLVVRST